MIPVRRSSIAVAAVALAAVVTGCGGGSDSSSVATVATVPEAPTTVAAESDESAPETTPSVAPNDAPEILQFTSPLVGGGELDAATLGNKPTAFWFWSPT